MNNLLKKPEFVIAPAHRGEIRPLIEAGADALIVGESRYALRMPGYFTLNGIAEAAELIHRLHRKIYVVMNAFLHAKGLEGLSETMKQLSQIGVDGIYFGDPAVLVAARENAPEIPLFWNAETLSTNARSAAFWAKKGAVRIYPAREISQADVLYIKEKAPLEVEVLVHGITCIFHSKRKLVRNYVAYREERGDRAMALDRPLFMKQAQREEERYPIFEDEQGTHIMSREDISMINHLLPFLEGGVDAFRFESLSKPLSYNVEILRIYREGVERLMADPSVQSLPELEGRIRAIQPKERPLGTGFYFREQIY